MSVNAVTFVAPNLAWGEARGGSIPRQWGCDRRATKHHAKFGATLRAAVLFAPGGVARSLLIFFIAILLTSAPMHLSLAAEQDARMVAPPNAVTGRLPS